MKAFKKYFDYVSSQNYIPLYAITTSNKTTVLITERDIQNFTEEHSKVKIINHISFFMIRKIERRQNHISINVDTTKAKKGYYNESNENNQFNFEFETNDASNFIIYLNRALYRILTTEELDAIAINEYQDLSASSPILSSALNNDGLTVLNNSGKTKEIQPFYIYSRFIEKVLLENLDYFTNSIESIVSKDSLKNLKKILKYQITKINVFKDFPDCQKYFQILINDIIPLCQNVIHLTFDTSSITTEGNDNDENSFNYFPYLIQLIQSSNNIKNITFLGELPSNINDFFTNLCKKRPNSLSTLSFKNCSLNQNQLKILKSSFISCIRFHSCTFDSNQSFYDFLQAKKLNLLKIKNSPEIEYLTNLNKFTNISVLSLCKCNIEISEFFSSLSNECRIQYLYLTGNKCEKEISNDIQIPKFDEIRLDHITWGGYFLSYLQILLKTQTFIDVSHAIMNDDEWNNVFNYMNTNSNEACQLCKLLWNGNQVSKFFFSYLRKCCSQLDSLQVIDTIDQTTEKDVLNDFTSLLKEGSKLACLSIGFSSQSSRSITGSQLKSILSALLSNMKQNNTKSFYFSVINTQSGDEGAEQLASMFSNQKVCKVNFINFDGLRPKSYKKYNELSSSIMKYLSKASKNNGQECLIEYPKNDLKGLKSQSGLQPKEYKKLCHDFCFNLLPSKLNYLPCDFMYDRMILKPCLAKRSFVENDLPLVDSLEDMENEDVNDNQKVNDYNSDDKSSTANEQARKDEQQKTAIDNNSVDDEFTDNLTDEDIINVREKPQNEEEEEIEEEVVVDYADNEKPKQNEKSDNNKEAESESSKESPFDLSDNDKKEENNNNKEEEKEEKKNQEEEEDENNNNNNKEENKINKEEEEERNESFHRKRRRRKESKSKKIESESYKSQNREPDSASRKLIVKEKQISIEFEEEEENFESNMSAHSKSSVKLNSSSSPKKKEEFKEEEEEEDIEKRSNHSKSRSPKNSPAKSFTPNRNHRKDRSEYSPQSRSRRTHRKSQQESSLMSFPLSSINSESFQFDNQNKSRVRRVKRLNEIEDDYYEFYDTYYSESDSDTFILHKNRTNDQNQLNYTPKNKRKKTVPQSAVIERSRKVDLLKDIIPKTVQQNRTRHHRHYHHTTDETEVTELELDRSRRSHHRHNSNRSSPTRQKKKNSSSFEPIEDQGSDIEFPEMDEITVKRQNRIWSSIDEKFSLDNIIHDIRANK